MQHWPFWLGGLALASISLGHWLVLKRQMAVSGRFTAIVNQLRIRPNEEGHVRSVSDVDQRELMAALREITVAQFGAEALSEPPQAAEARSEAALLSTPPAPAAAPPPLAERSPLAPLLLHALFLGGLALGGALSVATRVPEASEAALSGAEFGAVFGHDGWAGYAALLAAGVLVGFGTRMAGGCTSGHGLCGVSRLQKGSLVSTVAFFGAGVLTSFLLEAAA